MSTFYGMNQRVNILGVGISAINMTIAIVTIDNWIEHKKHNYICVTPVHGVMECQQSEKLRQIYNSAGFLMQVEADWVMRIIRDAKKPVMTIKPLASGALLPVVGLAFVWNTIRDQDMVTIGTTTPDEAREVIELSLNILERRSPDHELQKTRSKTSLTQ